MPRPTGQWPRATSSRRRLAMTMPSSISARSIRQASAARAATRRRFAGSRAPADQGHAHSMLIVAGLYASGRGVTKDNVKAYSWAYIVASASKVDEDRNGARQLMSLLMKRMTSDEIGRAVVAARAWRAVRTGGAGKSPLSKEPETPINPRRQRHRPAARPHLRSCSSRRPPPWPHLRSCSPRHPPPSRGPRRPRRLRR